MIRWIILLVVAGVGFALSAGAYEVRLEAVAGASLLVETPLIQGVKLEAGVPAGIDPLDLEGSPSYARLNIAGRGFIVLIDRTSDGARLYADANGDGKLEPIDWGSTLPDLTLVGEAGFEVANGDGEAAYRITLMWNETIPTVLTYFSDTYRLGEIPLPERGVRLAVIDRNSDGFYDEPDRDTLLIDVDGDGALLAAADSHERFNLDEPFNIAGTSYVVTSISPDGSHLTVDRSEDHVDPKPPLLVGYPAPDFEGEDADGNPFSLASFRGEIVVLDFWAGWCTPCIEELGTIEIVAERLAERGGTLIGISLDRSIDSFRDAVSEHGITYRQIYDGPEGPISSLYRIGGIPMIYLIDEEGIIRGRDLRGDDLIEAVDRLLDAGKEG